MSLVDTLSEEDEVGTSLFRVKETVHSFSPILGLASISPIMFVMLLYPGLALMLGSRI